MTDWICFPVPGGVEYVRRKDIVIFSTITVLDIQELLQQVQGEYDAAKANRPGADLAEPEKTARFLRYKAAKTQVDIFVAAGGCGSTSYVYTTLSTDEVKALLEEGA